MSAAEVIFQTCTSFTSATYGVHLVHESEEAIHLTPKPPLVAPLQHPLSARAQGFPTLPAPSSNAPRSYPGGHLPGWPRGTPGSSRARLRYLFISMPISEEQADAREPFRNGDVATPERRRRASPRAVHRVKHSVACAERRRARELSVGAKVRVSNPNSAALAAGGYMYVPVASPLLIACQHAHTEGTPLERGLQLERRARELEQHWGAAKALRTEQSSEPQRERHREPVRR